MPLLRRGPKRSGDDLIDRTPQNLPMQLGGLRVVRRNRRTNAGVKWWRRNAANIVASIGLIAALGGAYLAAVRAPTPAYIRGESIFVSGSELKKQPATPGLYLGNAAFMYVKQPGNTFIGTASATVSGKDVSGRCVMSQVSALEIREECSFWIGVSITTTPTLKSVDVFDLSSSSLTWKRHYSDGIDVEITVPASLGGIVPVPLPVGR